MGRLVGPGAAGAAELAGLVGLRRCVDLAVEVERLGLADQIYLTPGPRPGRGSKRRKPFLIDIRNPLSVGCLDSLVAEATHVYLSEPLQARPPWPVVDGVPHAAEMHIELLL